MKYNIAERFIARLEVELAILHRRLDEAREDIQFYRGKVERLELTLYQPNTIFAAPQPTTPVFQTKMPMSDKEVRLRQPGPSHVPFSDLKRKWNVMTAEEQEKALKDGWEVDKAQEETNAGK